MSDFPFGLGLGCLCGFSLVVWPVLFVIVTTPWTKCFLSGSPFTVLHIFGMRLRGTPVAVITDAHIALVHGGINIAPRLVESAYLSHPNRVHSASDLVQLIRWGLFEADPKPPWAVAEVFPSEPLTANPPSKP